MNYVPLNYTCFAIGMINPGFLLAESRWHKIYNIDEGNLVKRKLSGEYFANNDLIENYYKSTCRTFILNQRCKFKIDLS